MIQVRVKELLDHEDTVKGSKLMFGFLKATGLIQRLEQNKDCSGWVKPEGTANAAKTPHPHKCNWILPILFANI